MSRQLLLFLFPLVASAQDGAVASVETDQSEYAYGESIELRYTIMNEGQEPFTLIGPSVGCQAEFLLDDFDSRESFSPCSADDFPYVFEPGQSRVWIWHLSPGGLGVPRTSGEHTITTFYGYRHGPDYLAATTTVTAPRFIGGPIQFGLADGVELEDVQDVIDALNATETQGSYACGSYWAIEGTTLDDAIARYSEDPRFSYFYAYPCVGYSDVFFTTDTDETTPLGLPVLTAARPNPFTASTSFALTVPASGPARVEVLDLLGRRVAVLHDGPLAAGAEHHFTFRAADLPSGLYVVRATGEGFTETRRVTLAR